MKRRKHYAFTEKTGVMICQAEGGKDMVVIGNMANGKDIEEHTLIQRSNANKPFTVETDANGEVWLILGTDLGFEGN